MIGQRSKQKDLHRFARTISKSEWDKIPCTQKIVIPLEVKRSEDSSYLDYEDAFRAAFMKACVLLETEPEQILQCAWHQHPEPETSRKSTGKAMTKTVLVVSGLYGALARGWTCDFTNLMTIEYDGTTEGFRSAFGHAKLNLATAAFLDIATRLKSAGMRDTDIDEGAKTIQGQPCCFAYLSVIKEFSPD
ncbi:MAG: hypothetical protein AAFY17_11715 [Cyanobacteria bacterium J06642_11]